jgi:dienelactone hydrolase
MVQSMPTSSMEMNGMKTSCKTWLSQGRMTWGCLGLWVSSVLCAPFAWAQAPANLPSRIEYHALTSATTTGEEFLLGQKGKEVGLSGELRLPQGSRAKFPAVVLIHGSGGIGPAMDVWTHQLNQAGFATFVVDSFTGRGIVSTGADQTQLHSLSMTIDAYRALDLLAKHPRVDADKIAVLGFSKGALGAIFSASTRFKSLHGSGRTFAAHLGLYTPCNTRFIGDTAVTGKPMRLWHGTTDDYVSVAPCRDYVKALQANGTDVKLTEYPDTQHAFDNPLLPPKLANPVAQTTRDCHLIEEPRGRIINAKSKQVFTYQDSCVALGTHVGHNPDSTRQTLQGVLEFLKSL